MTGEQATVTVDVSAVLDLTPGAAQALAAVVGLARTPVGRPGSPQREELGVALAATLLRRLARAAGVANQLRVTVLPPGGATLSWPSAGAAVDAALAQGLAALLPRLGREPDDGGLRAALREEGARVAAASGS